MGVFYVLLFVPIAIQHIVVNKSHIDFEKKNRGALAFFFFFLAVLLMLRHESVGSDTKNYVYFFHRFAQTDWAALGKSSLEIGFVYFNKILSLFSQDPRFFLIVTAAVICTPMYYLYRRLCIDSSLSIVLFCTMSTFVMLFSGIRQMLAIAIGILAYEFTRKKKLYFFIPAVILAMSVHTSAIMLFFMYPLYYAKITKKWLYAVVPTLILMFVFDRQIFAVLGLILERYTGYDATIVQTGAYTMLMLFVIFSVFAFLIPDESVLDEETIGLRNFLLFSLAIQMFAPLHTIAMRMNYYYIIFIPLLLPKIIAARSKRWEQVAIVGRYVMVCFFLVYFFISASQEGNLSVFPYRFFWEVA